MASGGGGLEGGNSFEGVDDVFLAGLEAWEDLGSIQSPLMGVNGSGAGGGVGMANLNPLSGGAVQTFLGEEAMSYAESGDLSKGEDHEEEEEVKQTDIKRELELGAGETHPAVAQAQARAEAMVQGRGLVQAHQTQAELAEKKRKRAVLSKEERAKQNRDRNREHARNTRLRKKAFVEELKKQ
ncbi:unnamed protein product, partial [Discosporangium mesarthrocarpum]